MTISKDIIKLIRILIADFIEMERTNGKGRCHNKQLPVIVRFLRFEDKPRAWYETSNQTHKDKMNITSDHYT